MPQSSTRKTKQKANGPKADVALVHGRTDDGEGFRIIRAKDDRIEMGEVRSIKEGQNIQGEVVKLTQRPESPALFDCETLVNVGQDKASDTVALPRSGGLLSQGPAQIATESYRNNWDTLWGGKTKKPLMN